MASLWLAPAALAQVSFSGPTNLAPGDEPFSVAVGDFNGDGDPDLAVANRSSNNVSVLLGGAGGSFGAATNFAAGTGPVSVAVGDFNGDGDPDLAVANTFSDNVSVLLGGAGGNFGAATNYAADDTPVSVAVGDFNGDGDPDLAVANANSFSNNVSVLLGGAAGNFGTATNFAADDGPSSVAVGDFNADGDPDLAVANFISDNVSVLLGGASGNFGTATNFAADDGASSVAVGDFNADGDPDLAVTNFVSDNVSVLLGGASGTFGTPANFAAGQVPLSVAVGDFDADGDPDLATGNQDSDDVSVLLNTTPRLLQPPPPAAPLPQPPPPARPLPPPAAKPSCLIRGIVLVGLQPGGTRARPTVRLVGTADRSLIGRTVTILRNGNTIGTTRVAADGTVQATVTAPRGSAARTAARYRLVISGENRSQALKASRRARISTQTKLANGRLRVKGQISATRKRRTLSIRSSLVCSGRPASPDRTVRTDTRGRFTLVLTPPLAGQSAIYRIFERGSKLVTLPIVLSGAR